MARRLLCCEGGLAFPSLDAARVTIGRIDMEAVPLNVLGVRWTVEATVALSSIGTDRRTALIHALRELAAVALLALHGNDAGAMAVMPLEMRVAQIRVTYRLSEEHEIVVLRLDDLRGRLRIV